MAFWHIRTYLVILALLFVVKSNTKKNQAPPASVKYRRGPPKLLTREL